MLVECFGRPYELPEDPEQEPDYDDELCQTEEVGFETEFEDNRD